MDTIRVYVEGQDKIKMTEKAKLSRLSVSAWARVTLLAALGKMDTAKPDTLAAERVATKKLLDSTPDPDERARIFKDYMKRTGQGF